ncbi:MAG: trehalase family glycosidase [Oscillospiraceae bacterium]|nr:trehalase family glycosidase [Oscillospiraceae bacterium]
MTVTEYIKDTLIKCIRENKEDEGTLIGLPYPYTVPCIGDSFQELYYWDTYFINRGLILSGLIEQAKNNAENMFTLIERYGFMPNGNRTYYLTRTQPPFLSEMVVDIYAETGDKAWLKRAVTYLEKEYDFWNKMRTTEMGLSQYLGHMGNFETFDHNKGAQAYINRVKHRPEGKTDEQLALQMHIGCESGWDMTERFEFAAEDFAPVDLNSLLCAMERNIAYFKEELGENGSAWTARYEKRLNLMKKHMLCDGVLYDYNFKTDKIDSFFSCANLYPMWLGLLTQEEAEKTALQLYRLEAPYGIYAAEEVKASPYKVQWGYPNGWAPLHLIAIEGLLNYGLKEKALEIAKKYVLLVENCFEQYGDLWEKYNVKEGNINVISEGKIQARPMIGWSAGVYLYAKSVIDAQTA